MCSAVFQAGGLVVVVVEIFRRNFLASMVPVIVNAVLNEHQLVIDIVAFVIKGDFHRSRLGEKQRGKILAGWVTRKMRTIAQYSIRDPNGSDNQIHEEPVGRTSTSTFMRNSVGPGSTKSPSLHGAGSTLGMTAQMNNMHMQMSAQELPAQSHSAAAPAETLGHATSYQPSVPDMGPVPVELRDGNDITPTDQRMQFLAHPEEMGAVDYLPIDRSSVFDDSSVAGYGQYYNYQQQQQQPQEQQAQEQQEQWQQQQQQQYGAPTAPLPSALRAGPMENEGHAPQQTFYSYQRQDDGDEQQGQSRWQSQDDEYGYDGGGGHSGGGEGGRGGGLRVANRDSSESNDSWAKDALLYIREAK